MIELRDYRAYTRTHTHTHIYIYIYIYIYIPGWCIDINIYTHIYIYIYLCVCVCVFIYIYIYIYIYNMKQVMCIMFVSRNVYQCRSAFYTSYTSIMSPQLLIFKLLSGRINLSIKIRPSVKFKPVIIYSRPLRECPRHRQYKKKVNEFVTKRRCGWQKKTLGKIWTPLFLKVEVKIYHNCPS